MIETQVLDHEQAFFDEEAATLDDAELLIPPEQIERYRRKGGASRFTAKESLFAEILPLEGKRVLDYGCGHGENACLLAAYGADVTAFDLSPLTIAKAQRRAELNDLSQRIQFDVRAAGNTGYPEHSFDYVLGFAILHHLHMDLEAIAEEVARVLKPGGTAYFIEPLANSPMLRAVRRLIPVPTYATEHERQLVHQDMEPFGRHFRSVDWRYYYGLARLTRILGNGTRKPLRWLDYHAQRVVPAVRRFYGSALISVRH